MTITVLHGDMLERLAELPDASVDSCVCDPPYGITFIGKRWDHDVPGVDYWQAVYRVLKPGAHLVAFGGTRTYHRMVCAIEDAGFEIRDQLDWLYASGFPKSLDVSKAIDKAAGAEREVVGAGKGRTGAKAQPNGGSTFSDDGYQWPGEFAVTAPATEEAAKWQGWGTALKPAHEPICLARKPLSGTVAANVLEHGTGALNVDGCRVGFAWDGDGTAAAAAAGYDETRARGKGRPSQSFGKDSRDGTNTYDPHAISGRWPPNVLHDGSPEVMAAFARFGESASNVGAPRASKAPGEGWGMTATGAEYDDSGTAARFFPSLGFGDDDLRFWYGGKAGADDRIERIVEEVVVEWTSEQGPSQVRLQVDTGRSPQKAIVASGLGGAQEWSTFLCGNTITDLCRATSKSTISMVTNSTIELKTWKSWTRSLINACMAGVCCEMDSGGSFAESAEKYGMSASIILARTVSLPGASHAVSGTRLTISVSGKRHGHPTIKPVALMRWLVRLVTPPGGTVLDPFAGTGTTGAAAIREGFNAILVEREAEYVADIRRRLAHIEGADTPLFAGAAE